MTETEGILNTRTGEYDFIGRSIPIFPQDDLDVPPGEKAYIKVKAPFCDKLSGMICTKFFGRNMIYMSCHQDGGDSQGGTRHSMPPARRWGGFNLDDQ